MNSSLPENIADALRLKSKTQRNNCIGNLFGTEDIENKISTHPDEKELSNAESNHHPSSRLDKDMENDPLFGFQAIPEVPEEASSAAVTPRLMEEEGDVVDLNIDIKNHIQFNDKISKQTRDNTTVGIPSITEEQNDNINRLLGDSRDFGESPNLDISILSIVDSEPNNSFTSPNDESNKIDISLGSNTLKFKETCKNPKVPMLDLSKIKSPFADKKPNFSLNLSAISGEKCNQDNSLTFSSQKIEIEVQNGKNKKIKNHNAKHKRNGSFKSQMDKRFPNNQNRRSKNNSDFYMNSSNIKIKEDSFQKSCEKSNLNDSFINEANFFTEIVNKQNKHKRNISNLDLTFEKSDSKEDKNHVDDDIWVQDSVIKVKNSKKAFSGAHWNFGSKSSKNNKKSVKSLKNHQRK